MAPVSGKIQIVPEALDELADRRLRGTVQGLLDKLIELQDEFEESLLDQELWTSVDLLQNVGIRHHQVFAQLAEKIQEPGIGADTIKDCLREGRTAFSEWLFDRFKNISTQESPTQVAEKAFEALLTGIREVCHALPAEPFAVLQHEKRVVSTPEDGWRVKAGKSLKRLLKRLGKKRFTRRFSLQRLAVYHLQGRLSEHLLGVAQMLGEAEFFLLRRVRGLYEEIDRAYNGFLALLDQAGDPPDTADLTSKAEAMGEELDESFRLVGAEVMKYYDDIRQTLEKGVEEYLGELVLDTGRAGTVELPERCYQLSGDEWEYRRARIGERLRQWGNCQVGFTGAYTMGLEMARVQNRLRHAVDETVLEVNRRLWRRLEEQFAGVQQRLEQSAGFLREERDRRAPVEEVRARIENERGILLDFLENEVKKTLRSIQASGEINQLIDMLMERFRRLSDQTVESFQIVEDEDLPTGEGQIPGIAVLKVAPVRAVVRTYLEGELTHRLGDVNGAMLEQAKELEAGIEELIQTTSFSLGNVGIELREVGKKPAELIPVALGRLQRGMEGFQERFDKIQISNQETRERVVREVADTARLLKKLVLEETVREMHRKIEAREGGRLRRSWRRLKAASPRFERAGSGNRTQVDEPAGAKDVEPVELAEEEGKAEVLGYEEILELEAEHTERVPFAYRRLFRTTPLEVSGFLAGRSGALGIVARACKRWRQGRFSAVVVIGEQGSGKTSLINCAMEQRLKGLPLVRHRLEEILLDEAEFVVLLNRLLDMDGTSLDDLEAKISRSQERRVVLLEDLHRLHLRAMKGLDLLPRFLDFVDATGKHILWLVSIEQYTWQYLERIMQISRHFAFCIETGHLSRGEMEGAIMARHRATGYRLRFAGEERVPEGNQDALRRKFFDELHRACGGNVFAAIFYWMRSVEDVEEDRLVIRPLEELELEFLRDLPLQHLLSLAMLVEHGGLNAEHFSDILRISHGEGRARLVHLERQGILNRSRKRNGGDEYAINPILYHPLVVQMRRRNLLV